MPDEMDKTIDREQLIDDMTVGAARQRAASMPTGNPGECDLCEEWSGRLVEGVCAPCRDRHGLP